MERGTIFVANGLPLTVVRRISPRLLVVRDYTGGLRLHTGEALGGYRGYLGGYLHRTTREQRYRVTAWAGEGDKRCQIVRGGYKTLAGAEAALVRIGTLLHG